jgi:DNA invertase Pin-like site-specific DNA recombinase
MKAAIYARVSTRDQESENQLAQLRAWCAACGHEVVGEYIDHVSGSKGAEKRPEFARMFEDASRRKFAVLVFWDVSRLSREGMAATVNHLQRLGSYGCAFHSFQEPILSSDNEMVRDIVLAVMAALAKAERIKISERTKAGLERVRKSGTRSGKPIGRPALDPELVRKIGRLFAGGATAYGIAKTLRLDPKTVRRYRPAEPIAA